MPRTEQFYIDGQWVAPQAPHWHALIDPATEAETGRLAMGNADDVDRAVKAAHAALPGWAATAPEQRLAVLQRVLAVYQRRQEAFAQAMRLEMGAPITFARQGQALRGVLHLQALIDVMQQFAFERLQGSTLLRYEPAGVCGLIVPWNWPVNQIVVKVAPALAAGCSMVLKPSEYSPLSSLLFAEVLDEAGVPPGVFNLVNGYGRTVGAALSAHPQVDMVSFTGSTAAGIEVARNAAATVKRVAQELGGKSANLLLDDVDLEPAVRRGVAACFTNSGQSCSIPTRLLVPAARMEEAAEIARACAEAYVLGPTDDETTQLGPLVNRAQFERVQRLIARGVEQGARLVCGGPGLPAGIERGYYARPTVFADVTPDMAIAQEEIFGPVLSIMPYRDEAEAIAIANGTPYGLAAYVQSASLERAQRVARQLCAGSVHLNYPAADFHAPFGGRKQSGNGREWGEHGLLEYLEVKAVVGYQGG